MAGYLDRVSVLSDDTTNIQEKRKSSDSAITDITNVSVQESEVYETTSMLIENGYNIIFLYF